MNSKAGAYVAAIIAAALWGGNFVAVKLALGHLDPYLLTAARFAFAAALLPLVGWPTVSLSTLFVYALCSGIGQYLLSTVAIQLGLSPGIAALLMQFQVFISLFLSWAMLGETILFTTLIGSVLGLAGLVGVLATGHDKTPLLGSAVCLLAAAAWAFANLTLRRTTGSVAQLQSASALACLPVVCLIRPVLLPDAPPIGEALVHLPVSAYAAIAYIVIASFAVAQVLWGRAIKAIGVAAVSPVALLIPVCGVSLAWLVLDERMSIQLMAAVGTVLVGVALHLIPLAVRRTSARTQDSRTLSPAPSTASKEVP